MDSFKEAVIAQLDSSGALDSIRVQLRALVYNAVEKNRAGKVERSDAAKATETEEGLIAAFLVKDFLEFFKATYTLNVFLPECHVPDDLRETDMLKKLDIARDAGTPLIFSLFKKLMGGSHSLKHGPMPFRGEPVVVDRPDVIPALNLKPVTQVSQSTYAALDLAEPAPAKSSFAALDLAQASRPSDDSTAMEKKRLSEIEKRISQIEQSDKRGKLVEIKAELEQSDDRYEEDFEEEVPEELDNLGEGDDKIEGKMGRPSDSLGGSSEMDPSVDSQVLEKFDFVEPVKKRALK